jgi:hypothetical protein
MPIAETAILAGLGGIAQAGTSIYTNQKNIEAQKQANKFNADAIEKNNQKQWEYEWWRMQQERQWANDDWARANHYNSPAQQMQRLKEAGLNPHLIYGHGSAASNAAPIRGTSGMQPKTEAPRMAPLSVDYTGVGMGINSAISQIYNLKNMQADLANKEAQNKILQSQGEMSSLEASMANQLFQDKAISQKNKYAMSGVQLNNLKEDAKLKFTLNELKSFELNKMNPVRLQQSLRELKALGYENDINLVESELAKMNLTKGSNAWANTLITLLKVFLLKK